MTQDNLSLHPVDQLIREVVQSRRPVAPGEVEHIVERMATAPFDTRLVRVPPRERGLTYGGRAVLGRDGALFVHLVRRVLVDGQWAVGTTTSQFVADLRRAVRAPEARLAVYVRRGGHLAATVTPASQVIAPARRGPAALPELLVVYSADRGIMLTGY